MDAINGLSFIISIIGIIVSVYVLIRFLGVCENVQSIKDIISTKPTMDVKDNYPDTYNYNSSISNIIPKPVKRIHASKYDIFEFCHRIKNYDPLYDGDDKEAFIDNMIAVYNTRFFEDFRKYINY
jgi:hypothetical protein